MLHGAELRQEALPLRLAAEGVDHPGRHVVDRDIGGGRGAALRQFLEDDGGVEPRQRRAADIVLHIDAAEAERRRLAQRLDRKGRVLVPVLRVRHHLGARELPRRVLDRALLFGEVEVHAASVSRSGVNAPRPEHPRGRIGDRPVLVERENALDVAHQRPDEPPDQHGDPDDDESQDHPDDKIQDPDPERPDLELVVRLGERVGVANLHMSDDRRRSATLFRPHRRRNRECRRSARAACSLSRVDGGLILGLAFAPARMDARAWWHGDPPIVSCRLPRRANPIWASRGSAAGGPPPGTG